MTPAPPPNAPVQPAVMPVIALILGVLGFCLPPLFPIAIILAIVSLVKANEPAFAARKTLAIITLVMALVYIPVVGILAAIAIPNFIKFQARSKQSECKTNLKMAFAGQKSLLAEKDVYGTTAEEIGFSVSPGNRYSYRLSPETVIPATQGKESLDTLEDAYPPDLLESFGHQDESFLVTCAGNIDNDATIDVWSISSEDRTIDGQSVSAGVPFNHVNDVQD